MTEPEPLFASNGKRRRRPKVKSDSPEQRRRGREELARVFPRWGFNEVPAIVNATRHLESRMGQYVGALERMADEAGDLDDRELRKDILFKLLSLSSLGKAKVDVTAHLQKYELPDLSHLNVEQLQQLMDAAGQGQLDASTILIEQPKREGR